MRRINARSLALRNDKRKHLYHVTGTDEEPVFRRVLPNEKVDVRSGKERFITVREGITPRQAWDNLKTFPTDPKEAAAKAQVQLDNPELTGDQKFAMSLELLNSAENRDMDISFISKDDPDGPGNRFRRALEDMQDRDGWKLVDDKSNEALFASLTLQKNDVSRLHTLREAFINDELIFNPKNDEDAIEKLDFPDDLQAFVVAHDWAKVIQETGDFVLPFDNCAFEYRYSNRSVIILAKQLEGLPPLGVAFYRLKSGEWLFMGDATDDPFWWKQIRAACIMLDAEVAVHHVERAPHALNAKRLKAGKTPVYDYHVIDLSKRHKAAIRSEGTGQGAHKRLHTVRGHWRHYEDHKTWIKWHLRGDPDLGFIEKEYKL